MTAEAALPLAARFWQRSGLCADAGLAAGFAVSGGIGGRGRGKGTFWRGYREADFGATAPQAAVNAKQEPERLAIQSRSCEAPCADPCCPGDPNSDARADNRHGPIRPIIVDEWIPKI